MLKRKLGILILAACFISLPLICTAAASTVTNDEYLVAPDEKLTQGSTITVGKSGAVDYLTSNYATDDACIQAALNAAKSGDTITIYEGEYNIVKQVSQKNKDLNIIGSGDVTFNINTGVASQPAFYFYGADIDTEYLAFDAKKGETQVVLNDASNVRQSDLIKIWKDVQWCPDDYPQQKTGEMYLVESVNGNTVTLNQPLIRDYSRSDNSISEIYRPIRIHIDNLKFQNSDSTGDLEGLALRYCKDSSITNCQFDDNGQASIRLYSCFNVVVAGNSISDSNRAGRGYGVSIADATAFVNVHDNRIENCRHDIMSGTAKFKALNRDVVISNNTLYGSSVADANVIDAHPMTIDYTVTGNSVYPKPGFFAFYDGTLESVFSDNYVYGGGGVKRRGSVDGGQHVIKNNDVEGGSLYQSAGYGVGDTLLISGNSNKNGVYGVALYTEDFRKVTIDGNTFDGLSDNGIYLVMQSSTSDTMDVTISNNVISNVRKNGMYLKRSSAANKMNLKVTGNTINKVNLLSEYYNGIYMVDTWEANVANNYIPDDTGSMYLGIRETGSNADWNYIHDNVIRGGSKSILTVGSNTISRDNFDLDEAPTNHAPVMDPLIDQTVKEGSSLTFTVKATDTDGDSLTYSATNLPTGAYFDSTSGVFSWIPGEGQSGNYGLTFTVSDGKLDDSVEVSITVLTKESPEPLFVTQDSRLREGSPDTVFNDVRYLDLGGRDGVGAYRDLLLFDLSEYESADLIENATLSLFWYYPEGTERPVDTIVEIYRPDAWNPDYVTWNSKDLNTPWANAGGDWYDLNNVAQGSTPYATITIKGSDVPDNSYHELDVTELVREYVSGEYENTGFLIKARTESGDYIAFYSSDCGITESTPKLDVELKTESEDIPKSEVLVLSDLQDSRLREGSPDTVFNDVRYLDLGGRDGVGAYRDLLLFNLSELENSELIGNATLSLFWYYPEGTERSEDTVVEIYRPDAWNPDYVTWNSRDLNTPWANAGGDWYDLNNVAQGSTPYATITIKGSDVPDNSYHELDVTELVKEYVSGKYENTGFLIKARTESGDYIAFYSNDCGITESTPKLDVELKTESEDIPKSEVLVLSNLQDTRLREGSPDTVFNDVRYLDLGGRDGVGAYRDLLLFDLSEYENAELIENATLSLFWYYPEGTERPEDTIVEIYRPDAWNPDYVTWNSRDLNTPWTNAGGDWYDLNNVAQGSTPYATITIKGSDVPDSSYHELDVTELVKEYVSGKYENTGFLIKARTESGNYIAFYSNDCGIEDCTPKLKLKHRL